MFAYILTDKRFNYNKFAQTDICYVGLSRHPWERLNCHNREPGFRVGVGCKPTSIAKGNWQLELVIPVPLNVATAIKKRWRQKRKIISRLVYGPRKAKKLNVPVYCRDKEWTKKFLLQHL